VANLEMEHRKSLHALGFTNCTVISVLRDLLQSTTRIRIFAMALRDKNIDGWVKGDKDSAPTISRLALKRAIEKNGFGSDLESRVLTWFSLDNVIASKAVMQLDGKEHKFMEENIKSAEMKLARTGPLNQVELTKITTSDSKLNSPTTGTPFVAPNI